MKLRLLGTTGYHPNDTRQTACFMLPELGVVFDAGTAMYRVREHLATDSLDIFLTHAHLDHVIGLTFLFDVLWQNEDVKVRVHAESSKIDEIQDHLFSETLFPAQPPFEWVPLAQDIKLPTGERLSHFPLKHPGGSVGYRLDGDGYSMAYVTDTTADPNADYIDSIRDVDVLVHECYFPDGWEERAELTGHSCTTPVCEVAKEANVGGLIMVHINPLADHSREELDKARSIFPNTMVGEDNMIIDLSKRN